MVKKNKDKNNKQSYIFTRETMGMTILLFCAIVLLMLFTGRTVFAGIGRAVCTLLYGTFGYGSYLIIALLAYLGEWLVFEKKIKIPVKVSVVIAFTVFCAFMLFHAVTTADYALSSYGAYISDCYKNAASGFSGYTFGGVISAIIVYPVAKLTTFVGAYIIFTLLTLLCCYLLFIVCRSSRRRTETVELAAAATEVPEVESPAENAVSENVAEEEIKSENSAYIRAGRMEGVKEPPVQDDKYSQGNLGRKILFEKGEFDAESYRRNMIFNENSYFNHPVHSDSDYLKNFTSGKKQNGDTPKKSYSDSYEEDVLNKPAANAPTNYVFGEKPVEQLDDFDQESGGVYSVQQESGYGQKPAVDAADETYNSTADFSDGAADSDDEVFGVFDEPVAPTYKDDSSDETDRTDYSSVGDVNESDTSGLERSRNESDTSGLERGRDGYGDDRVRSGEEDSQADGRDIDDLYKFFGASSTARGENRIDSSRLSSGNTERSRADIFDSDEIDDDDTEQPPLPRDSAPSVTPRSRDLVGRTDRDTLSGRRELPPTEKADEPKQEEKPRHIWKKYVRPTLDLLDDYPENNNVNTGEIEDNKRTIVETLGRFKIDSEVVNVTIGPAITRYDVIIEDKTKIKQALNYKESIAMALMKENVNAYLNYSKGALSIEVPNNARAIVGLKTMLASQKFINSKSNSITFALGKNLEGEAVCPDITKMPHLLVAGTTGSGKSICLSALLVSLLYKYGPEELRLILVDPKQVEFISYDKLPHLMINEIIYEVDKAIKALNWAIKEMERRYSLFKEMTESGTATKNLDEYNSHLPEGEEKLPKIVIILDEFGDLMLQAKKDIESRIIKLVQKARACGIHLILATQRPSVDCITGLIKSNLPTRIGFKVNSFDDSRTIFDIGGAEKLLGKGDMYFRSAESPDLARIQGCFVDTHEVQKVTDFVKTHNETYFDQSVSDFINTVEADDSQNASGGEDSATENDTKIDDTFIKALKYCVTSNQASVSMIQRRFPVGYIKACKIIDWMENMNYITHSEGPKPRKVLMTKEEFINTYGDVDD